MELGENKIPIMEQSSVCVCLCVCVDGVLEHGTEKWAFQRERERTKAPGREGFMGLSAAEG